MPPVGHCLHQSKETVLVHVTHTLLEVENNGPPLPFSCYTLSTIPHLATLKEALPLLVFMGPLLVFLLPFWVFLLGLLSSQVTLPV